MIDQKRMDVIKLRKRLQLARSREKFLKHLMGERGMTKIMQKAQPPGQEQTT